MFSIGIDNFLLNVHRGPLPEMYGEYRRRARLVEEFAVDSPEGEACLVTAGHPYAWPFLVVAQRFQPYVAGFNPGILLVAETGVLFIGAGERLLAYSLQGPKKLWEDHADTGFWGWQQHDDCVLMSAELELAAWRTTGEKLWTTFVEPPWSYRAENGQIHLDVMGLKSSFPIVDGPSASVR